MVDYVDEYGNEYDFTEMKFKGHNGNVYYLEVRNGKLGRHLRSSDLWYVERLNTRIAYEKWLDKQIYGDSNG